MRPIRLNARNQLGLLPSEWPEPEQLVSARKKDDPEELFASQCRMFRLPTFEQQHRFAKTIGRQWRFDFAFLDFKLAVEIEGLVVRRVMAAELLGRAPVRLDGRVVNVIDVKPITVTLGRHATITGMREDCDKYNTAAQLGWTVLRFEQAAIKPKHAIETTMRVLAARGWKGAA